MYYPPPPKNVFQMTKLNEQTYVDNENNGKSEKT